jgi:hypothetical protein
VCQLDLFLQVDVFRLKLVLQLAHFFVSNAQGFFGGPAIRDVHHRANVPEQLSVRPKTRNSRVVKPTKLAISPAHSELRHEWLSALSGGRVHLHHHRIIILVENFAPAAAEEVFQASAGEINELLVEELGLSVFIANPHDDRTCIGHLSE